jgi:hypothetical protein
MLCFNSEEIFKGFRSIPKTVTQEIPVAVYQDAIPSTPSTANKGKPGKSASKAAKSFVPTVSSLMNKGKGKGRPLASLDDPPLRPDESII